MNEKEKTALQYYEDSEREILSHWIWSLCHITPGDFDQLIFRLADRLQGVKLDWTTLKSKAHRAIQERVKKETSTAYAVGSTPLRTGLFAGLRG